MDAFRLDLDAEVAAILSNQFNVVITETDVVPSVDDADLTYPNLDTMEQRCKLLESCILLSSSHGTGALTTEVPLRRCLSPSIVRR